MGSFWKNSIFVRICFVPVQNNIIVNLEIACVNNEVTVS